MERPEQACRLCGEMTLGQAHDPLLCRECDIEETLKGMECPSCGRHQWNDVAERVLGLPVNDHEPGCAEKRT